MNLKAVGSVLGFCCSVFVWNIGKAEAWVVDHRPGLVLRIIAWPFVFLLTWTSGHLYDPFTRKWAKKFPSLSLCFEDVETDLFVIVPLTFMINFCLIGGVCMLWFLISKILQYWTFAVLAAIGVPMFLWYCLKKYRGSTNGD